MFRYDYIANYIEQLENNPNGPLQVELHPGVDCGPMSCRHCYGKLQNVNEELLTIDQYTRLLDDLEGKTDLIEISGISTDPLTYPYIMELIGLIKERGFRLGIHTKGVGLSRKFCELLNTGDTRGSYITISLDAAQADIYGRLHGCPDPGGVLKGVTRHMQFLKKEKEKHGSKLRINAAYLLFKENSAPGLIFEFIEIFEPLADVLRFSIPQLQNKAPPIGFLSSEEIMTVFDLLKGFEKENIIVLKYKRSERDKNFNMCMAQQLGLTIDKAGNVFPCPQVSLLDYNHLSFGNIRNHSIWDIWNSEKRKEGMKMEVNAMGCRVCGRKDEAINTNGNEIPGATF